MLSSFLFVDPSNIWSRVETFWKYCLKHWFIYKFKNFELCWRGMRQLSNWVDLQFCLILAFICADTIETELVSSLRLVWIRCDQTFLKKLCFLFCVNICVNIVEIGFSRGLKGFFIINNKLSLPNIKDPTLFIFCCLWIKTIKKIKFSFYVLQKFHLFCRLASCWTVLSSSSVSVLR